MSAHPDAPMSIGVDVAAAWINGLLRWLSNETTYEDEAAGEPNYRSCKIGETVGRHCAEGI
jgi:hypothetical protein